MDFLRRLDPARAAASGAARLDVTPRWLEPPAAPVEGVSVRPLEAGIAPMVRPMRAHAALQARDDPPEPGAGPDARTVEAARAARPSPRPSPNSPALETSADARPARTARTAAAPPGSGSRPSDASSTGADAQPGNPPQRRPETEASPRLHPVSLPFAQVPSRIAPDRPLRADALAERRPRLASEPPIVHVTIDRIDVRLPAVDAAPSPRERRPRAASAVRPLSEYLRGGGRG